LCPIGSSNVDFGIRWVSLVDSSVAKKAAAILVDKPGQQLKNGKQVAAVLEELGLIRHFTNMNVLLFNSKDRSAVEIHGNAQISEASARDMMKSEEMSNARADFLMMLFDVNNDGVVDYQELALGLTMQSDADNKERGAFYFDVFDKDKSGTLSRSEIMDLYSVLMRAMFGMVATGVASELMKRSEIRAVMSQSDIKEFVRNFINELKKLQLEVRLTQLIFEKVDKDDSGTITKEEYIAFLDDEDAQAGLHRLVSSTFAQMQAKSGVIAQNEAMAILKRKYRI
jgi:Ca2+-binding EF-hand superfamily protein